MITIAVQRMDTNDLLSPRWPSYRVSIPGIGRCCEDDGVPCGGMGKCNVNDRVEFWKAKRHSDDIYFPHICSVPNGL
jgi:hypothetical protein